MTDIAEKLNIFKPDVKVELGCHCQMPMASTTASATNKISCNACLATYHIDCLSDNEHDKAKDKKIGNVLLADFPEKLSGNIKM
jgi:hypothetical protein